MSLKISKEIKLDFEPCVLAYADNKLFVGGENGSIQCFNQDLSSNAKWQAHYVQIFALAAGNNGHVYSASNDGVIRVWSSNGDKLDELKLIGGDVEVLKVYGTVLFAGDQDGKVSIYSGNSLKDSYSMLEEVRDLAYSPPLLFTVRDLDVTVTEIHPEDGKSRFVTWHSMEGRAPICLTEKYLFVVARVGNTIISRENNLGSKYKNIQDLKISDMILTGMGTDPEGSHLWTCGWDKQVRRWEIQEGKISAAGNIDLGSCVNAIIAERPDEAFAAVAGGRIVKLQA